ncbi:MAG: hypothetical protein EZS28_001521 [Streblomastix strix]|uniref:Uncharacterized protein n=1 Tax=Streblomastix strix TaxID=222440 RepID=A0A5J4X704_9EUKA|nr:MAG: hypothetical protein EZS28_001521 [Streblomastix strix]
MVQSIIGSEPFKDISESTSEEDQRQDYQTILNVLLKHIRQLQIDVPILESVFAAQRLVDGDIETFLYLFDVLFFLTKDKEDEPQLQEDLSCFHKTLNVGHFNQDNQQEKCSLFRIEEALINFSNLKKKRFEEEIQLNKCDEMYKDREQEKEAFITPFQTPLFARLIRQTRPISLSPAHSLSISNSSILEHELEKGRDYNSIQSSSSSISLLLLKQVVNDPMILFIKIEKKEKMGIVVIITK